MDLKICVVDICRIKLDFFEKPMLFHAKTIQSDSTKFSSMAQKIVRRVLCTRMSLNTSHDIENMEIHPKDDINLQQTIL
jgi:hypothetical protein